MDRLGKLRVTWSGQLWYLGRPGFVWTLLALFIAAILFRLPYEFHRLLFLSTKAGGIDLRLRFEEVRLWFAGDTVYGLLDSAVYPPASYAMLWPFMGWASWETARWVWAASTVVALAVLIVLLLRNYSLNQRCEKLLWSLFVLAHYATGVAIGNGQLTIHVLTAAALCVTSLTGPSSGGTFRTGLAAALSLVKPSLSLPFMWLVLLVPGRRAGAVAGAALLYAGFAVLASLFQERNPVELHQAWLGHAVGKAVEVSTWLARLPDEAWLAPDSGYGDVNSLFSLLGIESAASAASLVLFFGLGALVYRFRASDPWILMGIAAVVGRVWTYHRVYDDMLIIFAVFAVAAVLKSGRAPGSGKAGTLLLQVLVVCSIVPASLRLLPPPWDLLFKFGQAALWLVTLIYLLTYLRLDEVRRSAARP